MRRCHFPRLLGLLFATLALCPGSIVAQEVCVGDQCNPPGSIYRTIVDMAVSGQISAGVILHASGLKKVIINTLSDLRGAPVPPDGSGTPFAAERLGFASPGDGGYAVYVWSRTSSCVDDGGGCVKPSVGAGRWVLIPTLPLNKMVWGLSGTQTFYVCKQADAVNCTGAGTDRNGTNYCLLKGDPCLTINQAVKQFYKFPAVGGGAAGSSMISIGAGTYAETVNISGPTLPDPAGAGTTPSEGQVWLVGAGATTIIAGDGVYCGSVIATGRAIASVRQLKLTATALACQSALFAQEYGFINVYDGVSFGAANQQHMHAEELGDIEIWNSYTIAGNASAHWGGAHGGIIDYNPNAITITLSGTPAFTYFALLQSGASVRLATDTAFSGSATGAQFNISAGAKLVSDNSAASAKIPGNATGYLLGSGNVVYPEAALGFQALSSPTSCAAAGLGAGCSITVTGTSRRFRVSLGTGGAGVAAFGGVQVLLGLAPEDEFGTTIGCVVTPSDYGNTTWPARSTARANLPSLTNPSININWSADITTLNQTSTYTLEGVCPG